MSAAKLINQSTFGPVKNVGEIRPIIATHNKTRGSLKDSKNVSPKWHFYLLKAINCEAPSSLSPGAGPSNKHFIEFCRSRTNK